MANIEQRIAENISQIMDRKGVTRNALHELTGISYNTLKRRVTDGRGLEVYELEAISNALDVDPLDLMTGDAVSGQTV